jgi:MFS family permease
MSNQNRGKSDSSESRVSLSARRRYFVSGFLRAGPGVWTRAFVGSHLGGLPRELWIIWTGTLVNRMGTMAVPFLTLYLVSKRGFSIVEAGAVLATYGLGSLCSQLLGGHLADRFGRRRTLAAGTTAAALTLIALAYARSIGSLIVLVAMLGLTLELYRPAAQAMVADLIPASERARAFNLQFWAANLGFAVAMAAGGFLAQAGFTGLFWVDALTGAAFGLLVCLLVPETRRHGLGEPRGSYRQILPDRIMIGFVVCVLIYYFIYFQCDSTLPLAIRADGLQPSLYGLCMTLNGLLICLIGLPLGARLSRGDPGRVWAVGALVVGLGFGVNAVTHTAGGHFASVAIWTVGEVLPASVSGAIVASLAPDHLQGRYAGLYGLAWSSGWLTSSLGGARLFAASPQLLWGACAGLGVFAAAGSLFLAPRITARAASKQPEAKLGG